jgi:hypothetical protein
MPALEGPGNRSLLPFELLFLPVQIFQYPVNARECWQPGNHLPYLPDFAQSFSKTHQRTLHFLYTGGLTPRDRARVSWGLAKKGVRRAGKNNQEWAVAVAAMDDAVLLSRTRRA